MIPIPADGPAVEPVSVPEMNERLRVCYDAEDALIGGLIRAARLMVEAASRRLLVGQRCPSAAATHGRFLSRLFPGRMP